MTPSDPLIGEPELGKPNPQLERVTGVQKTMLLFIVVGLIVLIWLLAYLPSIAAT